MQPLLAAFFEICVDYFLKVCETVSKLVVEAGGWRV